jgi:putative ABC transport system substrate-binding protein
MKTKLCLPVVLFALVLLSCGRQKKSDVPVVGFVDYLEDATLSQARAGFTDALKKQGFSEKAKTVKIEYRNAQGSLPTLTQIVNYFVSEKVDLLATCTTLSTLTSVQKTKTIPIFEMVSPTPERMKVLDAAGKAPVNLFGTMEDLQYIDTSFNIIPQILKPKGAKLVIGMIYNQAEPQSADAMEQIKKLSDAAGIKLIALPLNTSADAQLVTKSLLGKNICFCIF